MEAIKLDGGSKGLLAHLASELSAVSVCATQALVDLQELIDLEERLQQCRDEADSDSSGSLVMGTIAILTEQCNVKACELKRCYINIHTELCIGTQPAQVLDVLAQRLTDDYAETFRNEGLL